MRLGIFGGTFDPPHVGHLLMATDAFECLALDRVVFVPAGTQPLKVGDITASAADRRAMVERLVGDDPRFVVDPIEIDRGGLSFMVDTLATLAERWPAAERYLLVGSDVLASFHKWREPARVRRLATLAVLTRAAPEETSGATLVGGPPVFVPTRRVDVSSTEIRRRVRAGQSIRGFVPESVAAYITAAALYR